MIATVWLLDSRTVSDEKMLSYIDWLNPAELHRYRRFIRPQRQRQFLSGRIMLRFALARLLAIAPQTISLSERPGLAPLLDGIASPPGFSLSHSGPWIGCAVSAQTALGLDIEMLDGGRDLLALAEQAFDGDELTLLKEKKGEELLTEFYSLWSSKEARYKLASTTGMAADAHCTRLPHAEISIVLCSAQSLAQVQLCDFCAW